MKTGNTTARFIPQPLAKSLMTLPHENVIFTLLHFLKRKISNNFKQTLFTEIHVID